MSAGAFADTLPDMTRRGLLPPAVLFGGVGLAFGGVTLAAGAPTPLLVFFEHRWGFHAEALTIAFAIYCFGLLFALLVFGSLSDYIGRRPVLMGALLVQFVAMLMFFFASGIGWLIAARAVQGIATGAAFSAFTAALVELAPARHKELGAIIGSAAPTAGLALGALLTGVRDSRGGDGVGDRRCGRVGGVLRSSPGCAPRVAAGAVRAARGTA
jgi:MFS family permease